MVCLYGILCFGPTYLTFLVHLAYRQLNEVTLKGSKTESKEKKYKKDELISHNSGYTRSAREEDDRHDQRTNISV